jgi:hypothetical protein
MYEPRGWRGCGEFRERQPPVAVALVEVLLEVMLCEKRLNRCRVVADDPDVTAPLTGVFEHHRRVFDFSDSSK